MRVPLRHEFDEIRLQFFPRWVRGADWQVTFGYRSSERDALGHCDQATKTIFVAPFLRTQPAARRHTLVHEVCHAVAGAGHGATFSRRLRAAARRAEKLGDHDLAWRLTEEAGQYEEASPTAAWVYSLCA
jgi:hypothetical protein